ncbi:MAG: hypothetical protein R3F02_02110 [Thiolinea sp.]
MPELTEKQKAIFHDIVIAHSPATLKSKLETGVKIVLNGYKTGGDEGMEKLTIGVEMLVQEIARYKLLKQAERRAEVIYGE